MSSPRYTVLIANRATGSVRRLTISRRPVMAIAAGLFAIPVLMGLGARWAGRGEVQTLQAANDALRLENESYRGVTGALTEQITSLQTAMSQLGDDSQLDAATKHAIQNLPDNVRAKAMGGPVADAKAVTSTSNLTGTFGALHDVLGALALRLESVRNSNERQQALANATPSMWPISGWLSSMFGSRTDPFTEGTEFHQGLDISADYGTPVKAAADGVIESAAYANGYGNAVVIKHGFGMSTRYGHLTKFAVAPGKQVKRGDVIGYVGATGRATGAHLHYEILINGQQVNPLRFLTH